MAALSTVAGVILKARPSLADAILADVETHPERVRAAVGLVLGVGWANAVLRRL
jgi:hypothetical protein